MENPKRETCGSSPVQTHGHPKRCPLGKKRAIRCTPHTPVPEPRPTVGVALRGPLWPGEWPGHRVLCRKFTVALLLPVWVRGPSTAQPPGPVCVLDGLVGSVCALGIADLREAFPFLPASHLASTLEEPALFTEHSLPVRSELPGR